VIKGINETGTVSVKKSLINPPNRKRLINFRVSEEELGFLVIAPTALATVLFPNSSGNEP